MPLLLIHSVRDFRTSAKQVKLSSEEQNSKHYRHWRAPRLYRRLSCTIVEHSNDRYLSGHRSSQCVSEDSTRVHADRAPAIHRVGARQFASAQDVRLGGADACLDTVIFKSFIQTTRRSPCWMLTTIVFRS